jgi:hypothetical protein
VIGARLHLFNSSSSRGYVRSLAFEKQGQSMVSPGYRGDEDEFRVYIYFESYWAVNYDDPGEFYCYNFTVGFF